MLVPSGKNMRRCPWVRRSFSICLWRCASLRSRAMKTVPVARAKPTDPGPVGDFGLGHEIDRVRCVQDEDVQPTRVIGNAGAVPGERPSFARERQPHETQRVATDKPCQVWRERPPHPEERPFEQAYGQKQCEARKDKCADCAPAQDNPNPTPHANRMIRRRRAFIPRKAHEA